MTAIYRFSLNYDCSPFSGMPLTGSKKSYCSSLYRYELTIKAYRV